MFTLFVYALCLLYCLVVCKKTMTRMENIFRLSYKHRDVNDESKLYSALSNFTKKKRITNTRSAILESVPQIYLF